MPRPEHRLALILADVLDMSGEDGARVLGIAPAAFRKRVSRARQRMRAFMERTCGLVGEDAPCRCSRQIGPSIAVGLLDPDELVHARHPATSPPEPRVRDEYLAIERGRRIAEVHRSHPPYVAPATIVERLRDALAGTSRS